MRYSYYRRKSNLYGFKMEEWRKIDGYNYQYEVSNYGNVRSKNKILTQVPYNGYLKVMLNKGYKRKSEFVHRLVAAAFLPNPDALPIVNHKNEIKFDNRVENLEWCTYSYNNTYGKRTKNKL